MTVNIIVDGDGEGWFRVPACFRTGRLRRGRISSIPGVSDISVLTFMSLIRG